MRDRKIRELLERLAAYNMLALSYNQLLGFRQAVIEAEQTAKWLDTSCKCKNALIKLNDEIEFRLELKRMVA